MLQAPVASGTKWPPRLGDAIPQPLALDLLSTLLPARLHRCAAALEKIYEYVPPGGRTRVDARVALRAGRHPLLADANPVA
ncbi:hypothetical protein MRX96_016199 [Rhipicephalus microplus]